MTVGGAMGFVGGRHNDMDEGLRTSVGIGLLEIVLFGIFNYSGVTELAFPALASFLSAAAGELVGNQFRAPVRR